MPSTDGSSITDLIGILAVLILVAANGFFVAAEFSLVAVRSSRVTELVAVGRLNASALERAVDNLDANLAATQLGITLSSLALGWVGANPPEGIFLVVGRVATAYYFIHFLIILPLLSRMEKARPLPASISEPVLKGAGRTAHAPAAPMEKP